MHLVNKNTATCNNAKNALKMLSKYAEVIEDEYFDESMACINICQGKFDDWSKNFILLVQKWVQIFNIFKENM